MDKYNLKIEYDSIKRSVHSLFYSGLIFFLLILSTVFAQDEGLRINEFMALNSTSLADEDGEYSDWIEIYNPTDAVVDLTGWSLTDDKEEPQKWQFSKQNLTAKSYLVVFASNKNRNESGHELHTNFAISGSGEYLGFFKPDGEAATEFDPAFPEQETDISFSFYENDYVATGIPTPGAANQLSDEGLLPPPVFSVNRGFYEQPFTVELTSELSDVHIYYTTDGSLPGPENRTEYTAPIQIKTTTLLRAVAVKSEILTSHVTTCTYLFLEDVLDQDNHPSGYPDMWGPYHGLSGNAIADYEMDQEIIRDLRYKDQLEEAFIQIPTISIVTDKDNLFSHQTDPESGGIYIYTAPEGSNIGRGWERPASIEYFNVDGSKEFQIDCGIRLHGGASRLPEKTPKHSFRLAFRSEYGPSRLNYPLFGEDATSSFNSLILRATYGNTFLHFSHGERRRCQLIHDIWAKQTLLDMGHPAGHGLFAHLYINGMYWGIYNPTERLDDEWAESYLGGFAEDYDVIKDYTEVAEGNKDAWNQMQSLLDSDVSDEAIYQRLQGNHPDGSANQDYEAYIDMVNLIDYMLMNFYGGNWDWDHHNWVAIRNRVQPGNGFKFFSWDAEHILEDINHNNLSENNKGRPSGIFQKLRDNANFNRLLSNRIQYHCFHGGALTPEAGRIRYENLADQIDVAIIAESVRWGDYRRDVHSWSGGPFNLYTPDYWYDERSWILDEFFPKRTNVFVNHLRQAGWFPEVEAPTFQINGAEILNNKISIGDVLQLTAPSGTIYYTTDGSDPWLYVSDSGSQVTEDIIVPEAALKYILVPDQRISSSWNRSISFDDSQWSLCNESPGGVGYDRGSDYNSWISLDVEQEMYNTHPTCYVRIPFTLQQSDIDKYNRLSLYMRYDDGFVAYINGVKVAEANAPVSPAWNSLATGSHEASSFNKFNVSEVFSVLSAGDHVLAIHGMNLNLGSSDFIISAELRGSTVEGSESAISPSAIVYSEPIELTQSTHVKARSYLDEWSSLVNIVLSIPSELNNLKLTEIHYHPIVQDTTEDDRAYEFVELKNTGNSTLDLSDVAFTNGLTYVFPKQTVLKTGEFIVLASNAKDFAERYSFPPFDSYRGALNNGGERLTLLSATGDTLFSIRYEDDAPWPTSSDGEGYSLVPVERNPGGDLTTADQWCSSMSIHGSPGYDDNNDTSIHDVIDSKPERFQLYQNYPNPFNPTTTINYTLSSPGFVTLKIYNVLGREMKTLVNTYQNAQLYTIQFDASDMPSGIYIYHLKIGNTYSEIKKLVLLR